MNFHNKLLKKMKLVKAYEKKQNNKVDCQNILEEKLLT